MFTTLSTIVILLVIVLVITAWRVARPFRAVRIAAISDVEEVETHEGIAPEPVSHCLSDLLASLDQFGFRPTARLVQQHTATPCTDYLVVCGNPAKEDMALVQTRCWRGIRCSAYISCSVQFASRFMDDTETVTINDSVAGIGHERPNQIVWEFPGMLDVGMLYEIHCRLTHRYKRGERKPLPPVSGYAAVVRHSFSQSVSDLISRGAIHRPAAEGPYRFTMRACLLQGLQTLRPVRLLNARRQATARRRLLTDLCLPTSYQQQECLQWIHLPENTDSYQVAGSVINDSFCPCCDYALKGLTHNRCPECGHVFDVEVLRRNTKIAPGPVSLREGLWLYVIPMCALILVLVVSAGVLLLARLEWAQPQQIRVGGMAFMMISFGCFAKQAFIRTRWLAWCLAVNRARKDGRTRSGHHDHGFIKAAFGILYSLQLLIGLALAIAVVYLTGAG